MVYHIYADLKFKCYAFARVGDKKGIKAKEIK